MRNPVIRLASVLPIIPATFVWFAAVACLVVMPAVIGSLRMPSYEASIRLAVLTDERRLTDRVEHVRLVVASPGIATHIAVASGQLIRPESIAERVRVAPEDRAVRLTATGETPEQARDLANVTGAVLEGASGMEFLQTRHAVAPKPDSLVDRVLARLPGGLPQPPHPIFSAAVGFVVGLLLYLAWLRRFGDEGRSASRSSPG